MQRSILLPPWGVMAGGNLVPPPGLPVRDVSLARLAVSLCWNAPLGPGLDQTELTMPAPGVLAVCWRYRGRSRAARTRTGRRMRQPCPAWARQWRPRSLAGQSRSWPGRPRRELRRGETRPAALGGAGPVARDGPAVGVTQR